MTDYDAVCSLDTLIAYIILVYIDDQFIILVWMCLYSHQTITSGWHTYMYNCIYVLSSNLIYILTYIYLTWVECMAQYWTWEREVWGSISGTLVMNKILGQDLNLHCLWAPSSNGYLVHRCSRIDSLLASFNCANLARGKGKSPLNITQYGFLDTKQFLYLYLSSSH
jgi:hypothetical protein